ncbi:DedA family protein [Actinacidiphila sp. bgisy167]|uniref:DedA family protein n=1 Tax=Actinacidiphila sp. bgisy167 TaxID=3413797 RepID=UPI003D72B194
MPPAAVPPPLPGPLADLAPLLDHWGYLAVALLVLLDNGGIPVPGQTVLVVAAAYSGTGRMDIAGVVALAVAAAVAGDCLGYLIGRSGGRALVHRWGRYVLLTPERFARGEEFFARRGELVVLFARFVDGLRQTNGIIAGTAGMGWWRFLLFNTLGAVLWVGVWAGLAFAAGTRIGTLYAWLARFQLYALIAVVLVAAGLTARHMRRRRARGGAAGR